MPQPSIPVAVFYTKDMRYLYQDIDARVRAGVLRPIELARAAAMEVPPQRGRRQA